MKDFGLHIAPIEELQGTRDNSIVPKIALSAHFLELLQNLVCNESRED